MLTTIKNKIPGTHSINMHNYIPSLFFSKLEKNPKLHLKTHFFSPQYVKFIFVFHRRSRSLFKRKEKTLFPKEIAYQIK